MCEFISWIEKDGEVLFLDDDALKDNHIRKNLKGCQDNDFIGHTAIRKAYDFKGGKQGENQDFWNGDLPQKIKDSWNNGKFKNILK